MRLRVYVAGPYSNGDPQTNTDNAIDVGEQITQMGADPFIPHLSHYRHLRHPHDYEFWIDEDLRWLDVCDALYRMPGDSKGADGEVAYAKAHGIPVFYSLEELAKFIKSLGGMGA
jgi:hypothetical protein